MTQDDEAVYFGFGEGCPIHGDEYLRECSVCGAEFCTRCHPGSTTCPQCSEAIEDDFEERPDFEDVDRIDSLLADDEPLDDLADDEVGPACCDDFLEEDGERD